jgi:large repetitive protein
VTFAASATDACSNATVTYSRQPGSFFPVGTTVVTVTAKDDCGNTRSATFTVTVSDTEAPKLTGVPADATVECTSVPAAANVTATDNCPNVGAVQYTEVKANGNCAGNYTLTRTWTVTDAHNNTTSATQTITVQDTKAPVLTAPANITVSNDAGQCGAKVSYAGTAADDCSNAHITYSHQPGSFFAKGTTTVTVTATDDCGNASSATFTVTVNDTENPVITCVSNQVRNTDAGKCSYATVGSEFDPSFGDNCPGSTVTNNYNNSSSLAGAIFQKGTTTVTWTVTDASGNTATCSSDVSVEDHENPTIVCVSNQSKVVDNAGCSYLVKGSEFDATFADNCPGSTVTNNYNNSSSLAGVSFPKGTTTVTWTVTDASGNTASCSYNVTVTTSLATFISSSNVLPQGTQPNTIYVGYTPAATLTLTANPSGGGGTYTYNWSVSANLQIVGSNTGSTVQVTTSTPGSSSAYTVNLVVTDQFGCFVSAQTWTVQVKDVRCGNKNDKVLVCHNTSSTTNPWVQICIAPQAVATHLGNGSMLGTCPTITSRGTTPEPVVRATAIKAYPNPSTGVFELQLQNYNKGKVEIQVIDNYGKLVAKQSLVVSASVENVSMDIRRHASGVYQVRVVSEDGVKTLKVVVAK